MQNLLLSIALWLFQFMEHLENKNTLGNSACAQVLSIASPAFAESVARDRTASCLSRAAEMTTLCAATSVATSAAM